MGVALTQEGAFGIGLQTSCGEPVAPTVWLPLMRDGETPNGLRLRKNYVTLDMGDINYFESRYFSVGEWTEGHLIVPMVPGSMTALLAWIQDRDQDNQGKWASLLCDHVNAVAHITDAKVQRARIVFRQDAPVLCHLDVLAKKYGNTSARAVTMPTPNPYLFREATMELATAGGQLEDDEGRIEGLEIIIDNMIEDPARSHRLYNLAGVRCRGKMYRDFVDSAVHEDFMAGQEAALRVELVRGASVCSIMLPRVLYTENELPLPNSHERRIVQAVDFVGLGSLDGLTAPVVLS